MKIPIGVANSVSANFSFDPQDAYRYAVQEGFDLLQVYLTESLLKSEEMGWMQKVIAEGTLRFYFHLPGQLNAQFFRQEFWRLFQRCLDRCPDVPVLLHFDETADLEEMLAGIRKLAQLPVTVYLENYFQLEGNENARKNLKKYLALFTLANAGELTLRPVLDIPRCFHQRLKFSPREALEWCFQILNYFGNRHLPLLLHLIDVRDENQLRSSFCSIGEGIVPYPDIFRFMEKNRIPVEGIVLEYEDKLHPLESRKTLQTLLQNIPAGVPR